MEKKKKKNLYSGLYALLYSSYFQIFTSLAFVQL